MHNMQSKGHPIKPCTATCTFKRQVCQHCICSLAWPVVTTASTKTCTLSTLQHCLAGVYAKILPALLEATLKQSQPMSVRHGMHVTKPLALNTTSLQSMCTMTPWMPKWLATAATQPLSNQTLYAQHSTAHCHLLHMLYARFFNDIRT